MVWGYTMDRLYLEQSVSGNGRGRLPYALCWLLIVLLVLIALFFAANIIGDGESFISIRWPGVLGLVICLGFAALIFRGKDHLCREYDYILDDDALEIHVILNRRRRKMLDSILLERISSCGPVSAENLSASGMRELKWYLHRENTLYYIEYTAEGVRRRAVLELSEEFADQLRRCRKIQPGTWKNAEGKTSNYASIS